MDSTASRRQGSHRLAAVDALHEAITLRDACQEPIAAPEAHARLHASRTLRVTQLHPTHGHVDYGLGGPSETGEELAGIIGRGDVESITGHLGRHLQVCPKAASSRSRRRGVDVGGAAFATLPRGFYLPATFTARILAEKFGWWSTNERP